MESMVMRDEDEVEQRVEKMNSDEEEERDNTMIKQ